MNLLEQLKGEFQIHAANDGLGLRIVPCHLTVRSDPRLLEQILRNLLSNALKYTSQGKVLLGCRRRGESLSIEVWDTGTGIPETELGAIFKEYHQLRNHAAKGGKGLGLGLGLAIVQHLADLLHAPIRVRSRLGRGSVFALEVPVARTITSRSCATRIPIPFPYRSASLVPMTIAVFSLSKTTKRSAMLSNCF